MNDIISFSVPGISAIQELRLGYTLLRFSEFDLNFFRDECVRIYRQYLKAGDDVLDKALAHKEFIKNCHPYCKALLYTALDKIALDCIIEEIRTTEGTGLEELWVKNMSATSRFGQALFNRVTEYKTGSAINQWTNLVRLKAYAKAKIDAIYSEGKADFAIHKARKLYYDFAFKLTAARLGFQSADLPRVRQYSVPFLPEAVAMMKTAQNVLGPIVEARTEDIEPRDPIKGKECVQDQMAGMALNLMMDIERPTLEELHQLIQMYGALPDIVYEPSGFKAIIDLEFDLLMERGYYLQAGPEGYIRASYTAAAGVGSPKAAVEEMKAEAKKAAANDEVPERSEMPADAIESEMPETAEVADEDDVIEAPEVAKASEVQEVDVSETPERADDTEKDAGHEVKSPDTMANIIADIASDDAGKVRQIIQMAEDPARQESKKRTLQEVNMRCNLIWTSMNVRSGWSISSEEAAEWFRYLTRLRYGIGTGELTPEALDKFLDATLEVYELLPENT